MLGLSACGGSIGGGAGEDAGAEQDAVKIGLLAPITGPVSPEGNAMKAGFEIGLAEVNEAGGIFGQQVELVFEDDKADPANATQLAQKFIQQEDVDYIFGTITGDTTVAVAQAAAASGTPVSPAVNGDTGYCAPHFWAFGETGYQVLEGLVPYMVENNGPKVAMVGNDYVFPHEFNATAKGMLEELGGEVVAEEYSPLGTSDWQPVLDKLRSAAPDWILTSVVGGDAIAFTQQANDFGILDSAQVTGVSLNQEFYPALQTLDDGRVLAMRYSDQLAGAENEAFIAKYRELTGSEDPIPSVAANAYVAAKFIAQAIEDAGSTDGAAISEAMANVKLSGTILGDVSFNADNHTLITDMYLAEIQPGGKYTAIQELGAVTDNTPRQCS